MSRATIEMHIVVEQEIGDFDLNDDDVRKALEVLQRAMVKANFRSMTDDIKQISLKIHKPTGKIN